MNSGLISGPVQAAKNGRWRKWELRREAYNTTYSPTEGTLYTTPPPMAAVVPIPSYVQVARVTAVSGGHYLNASYTFGGAVCKNVLLSVRNGRQLVVQLTQNGVVNFGTLLHESERAFTSGAANFDTYVVLNSYGFSQAVVYQRGVEMINVSTSNPPSLRPFLGGSLMPGFSVSTAVGSPNPINPQIRATSSAGRNPSILFGGPLVQSGGGALPGSVTSMPDPLNAVCSPSYICVEWME